MATTFFLTTLALTLGGLGAFAVIRHLILKPHSPLKKSAIPTHISEIVQILLHQSNIEFKGEHFKALTETVLALSHHPELTPEVKQEVLQQLKEGNTELAKQLLADLLEKYQTAPAATQAAAAVARYLGALAYLDSTAEAFRAYRQAVKLDPENPEGWIQLGHFLKSLSEFDKAQDAYEKVLHWAETHDNLEYQAIAYNHLGILFWISGDLPRSEEMHLNSLKINQTAGRKTGLAKQYGNLGILYRVRDELPKAEQMFLKALALDQELDRQEDLVRLYGNLGNLYNTMGDFQKAEVMFRKSLVIERTLKRQEGRPVNDLHLAELMYLKSLEISQSIRCKECMASDYSNLGSFLSAPDELQQAERRHLRSLEIETILRHKEGIADQYNKLGLLHQTRGDLTKAEEMYLQALEVERDLERKDGIANQYSNLGIVYTSQGKLAAAEEMLFKALELDRMLGRQEELANHYANLGTIYLKQGDLIHTKEMYLKSLPVYQKMGHPHTDLVQLWLGKLEQRKEIKTKFFEET